MSALWQSGDTIAAVATAQGEAGIAIVRVSGPDARAILEKSFARAVKGVAFKPRRLYYGHAVDASGADLDEVMAVFLPAPHTYTREDVAEIHCHGGQACAHAVLKRVFELGARAARPGEFTLRAFLNGRVDLSQAEAVMQLIGARSGAAQRAALRQLEGGVSAFVRAAADELTGILSLIAASDDFPDEVEELDAARQVLSRGGALAGKLRAALSPGAARVVREGYSVALCGRPNVGKSSLMNALLGQERAIVTDEAGTTRDAVTERMSYMGIHIELTDTAGQREAATQAEKLGVERARRAAQSADMVLLVVDGSVPLTDEDRALMERLDERYVLVANKCDLGRFPLTPPPGAQKCLSVSAVSGEGVDELRRYICERAREASSGGDALCARRHMELVERAVSDIERALECVRLGYPLDVAAVDLSGALESLMEITGQSASEELISRVFADFCVGK